MSWIAKLLRNKECIFLCGLLVVGFLLRSTYLYRDLFFGYDQGRDAFVMRELRAGDVTLIGPTTGLDGVFLGPFYYYLLFPWYWLGDGNPMVAAYAFVALHAILIVLLYLWTKRLAGSLAAWISALLFAVSMTNIHFSRWVANPTPLPLFALLTFVAVWANLKTKRPIFALLAGVLAGLCFQLEAANAVWFIPTIALLYIYEIVRAPGSLGTRVRQICVIGGIVGCGFFLVSLPQALFELRHNFLTTRNVIQAFQETHDLTLMQSLPRRLPWLYTLYAQAVFPTVPVLFWTLIAGFAIVAVWLRTQLISSTGKRLVLFWFFVPLVFHILYTGNHGNFWDYYVIGQYPAFFILIGMTASALWNQKHIGVLPVRALVVLLLSLAVGLNLRAWSSRLPANPERYSLEQQVEASRWIYRTAGGEKFGVWVYTPSYQDQANRYVLWWVGREQGVFPEENVEQQPLIYLFVEDDGQFWKRRLEWIQEKQAFGTVIAEQRFGALTTYQMKNTFLSR